METLESIDIKVFDALGKHGINGITKSAVIYLDETARFIYVCHHCGGMFDEISATLLHIESHFQLANVMVDQTAAGHSQLAVDGNEMKDKLAISPTPDNLDIKTEVPDELDDIHLAITAVPIIHAMFSEDETPKTTTRKLKCSTGERPKKVKDMPAVKGTRVNKEYPYRCHVCSKICTNVTTLRNHINKHPTTELLRTNKCKKCDEYFKSAATLRSHVLTVHLLRKTTDGIRQSDLVRYEERESLTEQQHSCEFCSQRFYIKSNLDLHLRAVHSSLRRLQCSLCHAMFTAPKHYYAHQLEHKRVGSNTNEFNETTSLASFDALIDERIFHEQSGSYRCVMCDVTAEIYHVIRSHIRNKHLYPMFPPPMEEKREFICDCCGVSLKSKDALLQHLMIHTNTKTHSCKFCGKLFRDRSTVRIHERQHTGEKPFQCHECGKAFIAKGLLTAHKKTHEDKTYPCHICGKVLKLPSGYRNHIKTHRVERDYKCTICEKTFNTRIYLTRHMEIHSERKHKCHYCDSTFNTGDGRR